MVRKVILVTGSSRGIGLGVLKKHGELGYAAVMSSSSGMERAAGALEELRGRGIAADYVKCDVSKTEDRQAALDFILERYGRIDVLVNNAGVAPLARMNILETTEDSFDRLIDINLKGTFFMCQLFANAMISLREKGLADYSPRIINIGSLPLTLPRSTGSTAYQGGDRHGPPLRRRVTAGASRSLRSGPA